MLRHHHNTAAGQHFIHILTIVLFALLLGRPAGAETEGLVRLDDIGQGELLLKTVEPGFYVAALAVHTDVKITVSGPIARTTVTQRFENPSDEWVEGIYVFPLPETSAVDRLRLRVGDRFIEGKIKERGEARKIYQKARDEGRKAGLVEQQRANIFTTSVANIGPGDAIVVQIEYQQTIRLDGGLFRLRFPMVVAPRYNPGPRLVADAEGIIVGDPVPDRDAITPPVAHPALGHVNPVTIELKLDAGFALGRIESPHHVIDVTRLGDGRATVVLDDGTVPADRDFELVWGPRAGAGPQATVFRESGDDGEHYLLTVIPPLAASEEHRPREAVFVIDVSGSMAGTSIVQAKDSLLMALNRLSGADSFNIIAFDHRMTPLFRAARPATPENLARARGFVGALVADGGTEMLPALTAALTWLGDGLGGGRLRQVVFLTDGSVGNEAELFAVIKRSLGQTRLFTVGIGSAPNSYFMRESARIGRGAFVYIGDVSQVRERMAELFEKLERPVLTNIHVDWPRDETVDAWPSPVPDLYYGEPVVITARLRGQTGIVRVAGELAGETWSAEIDLADAAPGPGVAALWARDRITALEESRYTGAAPEAIRQAVIALALDHRLVSKYTSLVAVDITPSRPGADNLETREVPLMLPAGWEWDKVFGDQSDPSTRVRKASYSPALFAAAGPPLASQGVNLPQTATPALWHILLGFALLLMSISLLFFLSYRRRALARILR